MQAKWAKTAGEAVLARRRPWGWRWFLLCAVALLPVVTGCAGSGHSMLSARPLSSCGPGLVPGYSDHRSYPPGIPAMPPSGAHIIGCFASAGQAAARGFPLPAPRGTVVVDGVIVVPAAAVMRSQCRGAARILGFAVPCPGLLPIPAGVLEQPDCITVSGCVWRETTPPAFKRFIYDSQFAAPPDYGPLGVPALGHVVLLAERASAASSAADRLNFCLGQRPIRTLTIDGDRATMVACPPGNYATGGHLLLRWVHHGVLAAVSCHGINATNIALDVVIARHMTWISPRS